MSNLCLEEHLQYKFPSKYRARMPNYEGIINLVTVNKNMARKILQVKKNNEVGIESVGGASGITSMLSRSTKHTTKQSAQEQQESILRLH
jgi:hypothetical protein